jgi:hypothetical protein
VFSEFFSCQVMLSLALPPRAKAKLLGLMAAGLASATVGLAASPAQAIAITAGIDNLSGGVHLSNGFPLTIGYEFSLSNAATVNALGSYDYNGDGLSGTYTVGLWDVAGTLLASAYVGTGDQLASSFRWADITDITIGAGNYIVASAGGWINGDEYFFSGSFATNQLTYVTDRYNLGAAFAFPVTSNGGFAPGYLGGNVSFASTTSTTSTSVPGPLPLLGVAAAFAYSRKLRKRIKLQKGTSAVSTSPGS